MTKFFPFFIRFRMIDIGPICLLPCSMRWIALFALAAFFAAAPAFAQSTPDKTPKAPTQLPAPKAEPENGESYASPLPHEQEGPSAADRGPVQKRFTIASDVDALGFEENARATANVPSHEKIALDKRVSISLVHDVQNDQNYKGASNHALLFEVEYINWGAVTQEQLNARRGHYFTITWKNGGPKGDFTARFEYRQIKSKEIIRTLTQDMPHVSGGTRSYFAVVDKAYLAYGPVCGWRFSILKGDTVVAETKSYIW